MAYHRLPTVFTIIIILHKNDQIAKDGEKNILLLLFVPILTNTTNARAVEERNMFFY